MSAIYVIKQPFCIISVTTIITSSLYFQIIDKKSFLIDLE